MTLYNATPFKTSRATLERRARKISRTITRDGKRGYYLDDPNSDFLDRRYDPYRTLRDVEYAIRYFELYATW